MTIGARETGDLLRDDTLTAGAGYSPRPTSEQAIGERRSDMPRRVRFECDIRGVPLPLEGRGMFYPRQVKPVIDGVLALLLIVLLLPLLALIALAIRLDDGGPVLFVQQRTGYLGRRFALFKFRTMVPDAEARKEALRALSIHGLASPDFKLVADPRVTRIGRLLRRTSLDELPNLLNIVRGEMSFVGPRPTSFAATAYALHHLPRLGARPGLTGLWQVSGRANIDFDQRAELDIAYIRSLSLVGDLALMRRTITAIRRAEGAH